LVGATNARATLVRGWSALCRRSDVPYRGDAGFEALALEFASKSEDKFARIDWDLSPAGLPILEAHSLAWAECTLEREIDAGDHLVLLGRVREGVSNGQGRLPLTYFRRAFGSWAAH
jgi:flavin reductase (DIM6/NTAB) family NADH-FMN oxidoreductase RutF